jgi:hypothetical protein
MRPPDCIGIESEAQMTTLVHDRQSKAQGLDVTQFMMLLLGVGAYAGVFSLFIAALTKR